MEPQQQTSPTGGSRGLLSWPLLVAMLVCLGFLLTGGRQILGDPDTYLHITVGEWIFQHGAVPVADPFSFTVAGAPWIAHEWLAECVMAGVYRLGGWTSLVLLAVACMALTLSYLLRFLLARVPPIYALLFTALAAAPLATHLLARPHVLTWPILAIWVGELVKAWEAQRSPPWWLLALMGLWANLHGSFTLGLVLVPWLACETLLAAPTERRWDLLRRWAAFFVLALLSAMLTPSGWQGIWFTFHLLDVKHLKNIAEWMPATSPVMLYPLELWLAVLMGLALWGLLRLSPLRFLLLMALLHQAMTAGRYLSIFGLMTPFLIATSFGRLYAARMSAAVPASRLDRFFERMSRPVAPTSVAAAAVLVLAVAWGLAYEGRHAPEATRTPAAAVDAAMKASVKGRVFNGYGFGGYLIFRGIPVFIDGRADLYGDQHLERYFETMASTRGGQIQQVLDEFQIGWTLLAPASSMLLYLDEQPEWTRVYADEIAVVHARRTAP